MAQKYIEGDFVMYHNKIMVIKEPRGGSQFDFILSKRWVGVLLGLHAMRYSRS